MMNLKQKVLAGLIAAIAAGTANAQLYDGSTGNSSLLLSVYNQDGDRSSSAFNLGLRLNDFLNTSAAASTPGSTLNFDLTQGTYASAWNSIKTAIGVGKFYFAVQAANTLSPRTFLSTASDPAGTVQSQLTGQLVNFAQSNDYWLKVGALLPTIGVGAVYTTFTGVGTSSANFGDQNQTKWKNFATFSDLGTTGSPLNFWFLKSGTTTLAPAITAQYAGTWSLDSTRGMLTYSVPVPEPGTWALMLAGLIGVGAIARRRVGSNVNA